MIKQKQRQKQIVDVTLLAAPVCLLCTEKPTLRWISGPPLAKTHQVCGRETNYVALYVCPDCGHHHYISPKEST